MRKKLIKIMAVIDYYFPFLAKILGNIYFYVNNLFANKKKYKEKVKIGKDLLSKLISNDKYYYVLIAAGIGDDVLVSSYAYILKEKYNKPISFIVLKGRKDIFKMYDYIEKIIEVSKEDFECIKYYINDSNDYETEKYKYCFFKVKMNMNGFYNWPSAQYNKKLLLSQKYVENVFECKHLKLYPAKINHNKKNIESIRKKYGIKNKSILLIPYAYTEKNIKYSFWNELTKLLINLGYNVYTNIGNPLKEKPIENTIGVNMSLDELITICSTFDKIISIRCGLSEFISLNSPDMILIDYNSKNYQRWIDVNIYSKKKKIKYIYINRKNIKKLINEVLRNI